VIRQLVELADALESPLGVVEATQLEAQLGDVQRRRRVAGSRRGDLLGGRQGLLGLAHLPVHVDQADHRARRAGRVARRLLEVGDGVRVASGHVGGVAERGERRLVLGVELHHPAKGVRRLLRAALGRERVAEVAPGLGIVGPQLGDRPQLVGRVVGAELHAGPARDPQQLGVARPALEPGQRRAPGRPEVPGVELRPRLV
jgi:hypothetical protein